MDVSMQLALMLRLDMSPTISYLHLAQRRTQRQQMGIAWPSRQDRQQAELAKSREMTLG